MLNKRKALIGYAVWVVGKPMLKSTLRQRGAAAASKGRPALPFVALALAAGGAALVWRRRARSRREHVES